MGIKKPIITEIAFKTYLINEFGLDAMYLLVGTERALVIDTGSGFCNLKQIVETLTDKPYDVALTHGHVDHAGGCDIFDEIYIHADDVKTAETIPFDQREVYGEMLHGVMADSDVWEYGNENVRKWASFPKCNVLFDGQVFDLGGRHVSVYYTPGHTKGSCSFIDDTSRILFSGDAANTNLLMNLGGAPISTALHGLLKLKAHQSEFDRNYNGHVGYASYVNCLSLPDSALDDCIAAFRGILDGSLEAIEYTSFLRPGIKNTAVQFGTVRVSFDKNLVWASGEEQINF